MHSISPYTIRCFNPALTAVPIAQRYSVLDSVGTFDVFSMLKEYIESHSEEFHLLEDNKQVFRFTGMNIDVNKRVIYGWLQAGSYGIKTEIINVDTGNVDFEKAQNNAEIIRHYVHFYFPLGFNEAIALLHGYRGNGIKTLFFEQFNDLFHKRTKLTLQMNPLGYDKAFKQWEDAIAKEIVLIKFNGLDNLEDQILKLGHDEVEVSLKPPKKGTFGKLKDFFNPRSDVAIAVELLSHQCSTIKTTVEINNKRRKFNIEPQATNIVCQIELDDSVKVVDGNPDPTSMNIWCSTILDEFCQTMYPNMEIKNE
jgi:hypothetical protein